MDVQKARARASFIRKQQETSKFRKSGRYIGLALGALAAAIYGFSMYSVKQETIIREIDEEIESIKS